MVSRDIMKYINVTQYCTVKQHTGHAVQSSFLLTNLIYLANNMNKARSYISLCLYCWLPELTVKYVNINS